MNSSLLLFCILFKICNVVFLIGIFVDQDSDQRRKIRSVHDLIIADAAFHGHQPEYTIYKTRA